MMVLLVMEFDKNVTSVNSEGLLYFTMTFLKNVYVVHFLNVCPEFLFS